MGFGENYHIYKANDSEDYIVKTYNLEEKWERQAALEESIYNDIINTEKLTDEERGYFLNFIERPVIGDADIKMFYAFYDELVKLDENAYKTLEELNASGLLNSYYSIDEKLDLIENILKCVEILHKHNIDHCNISPKNFIVYEKTKIKFIDFHLSCNYAQDSLINYIPPEIVVKLIRKGSPQIDLKSCDIFILGIIILEIIWGEHPFSSFILPMNYINLDIFYRKHFGDFIIDTTNKNLQKLANLIRNAIKISPNKRPKINELIKTYKNIHESKNTQESKNTHESNTNESTNQTGGNGGGCPTPQEYEEELRYGSGATGRVLLAHKRDNPGEKFVIKVINASNLTTKMAVRNEINILKKIKGTVGCGEDLLCYESDIQRGACAYIITKMFREKVENVREYLENLESKVSTKNIIKNKLVLMKNICIAIEKLHKAGIVHSDIKPENILVDNKNLDIQIIDFGFAYDNTQLNYNYTAGGTPGYIAPEIIKYMSQKQIERNPKEQKRLFEQIKPSLYKYDIFSLGMMFYEMINDISPISLLKDDYKSWFTFFTRYQIVSKSLYPEMDKIINNMIKYNTQDRIGNLDNIIVELDNKVIQITTQPAKLKIRSDIEMHIDKMIVETPLSDDLVLDKQTQMWDKKFNYENVMINENGNFKPIVLGKGAFGTTYLVRNKKTGKQYVSKVLKIGPRVKLDNIYNEIDILRKIAKEGCKSNLLCYVDYYFDETKSEMHIITDAFSGAKTLAQFINEQRGGYLPIGNLLKIMREILSGLVYLHKIGIAHADIKPENILIKDDSEVQIIDFGISCGKHCTKIEGIEHLGDNETCKCLVGGTVSYLDPEFITKLGGREYVDINELKRGDIYSLGMVFYHMANLVLPYPFPVTGGGSFIFLAANFYKQNGYLTKSERQKEIVIDGNKKRKIGVSKKIFASIYNDDTVGGNINNMTNVLIETMLDINPDTRPLAKHCMSTLNKIINEYNKENPKQTIALGITSPKVN